MDDLSSMIIHNQYRINRDEAIRIGTIVRDDALLLFHHAAGLRKHFRGDTINLCSIVNAKSGACSENCSFCAQSAHFKTTSPVYPLMTPDAVVEAARVAHRDGAESFGIVISGLGIKNQKELEAIGEIAKRIREEVDIEVHASLGCITREHAEYLRECGVTQLHHNLETSERYFANICTTHTFADRLQTLRNIKDSGLKLCAGGIFGMGETLEDRIDMAMMLREFEPETIPMNFLSPIPGTPLEQVRPMPPLEILMTIALYRFILPHQEIKICGGREKNLRDLQSMIFFAGADSMMIGNYLTTAGREPELDRQMMRDLDLQWNAAK
ncbi:MAG: biotin synthase BioB [Candidatus Omnitrophota bacterium]|nr:MAG: biotin synthase BioB [Candidatus Omnitrophota bacterium]